MKDIACKYNTDTAVTWTLGSNQCRYFGRKTAKAYIWYRIKDSWSARGATLRYKV